MNSVTKLITALAVLICFSAVAAAATLQAKVVEVPTGNTLVVTNTNRSVRIRLKAVVPPEAGQPFSEAARDHLRALLLDQTVMVDYTHLADGYLEARVILKGVDIGSQMLRDGVAWYDHATDYELTESDRQLYAQCEQAARAEKRGLWHDESPVAPWDYRRIQQAKLDQPVYGKSSLQTTSGLRAGKKALSNGDLMSGFMGGPSGSSVTPGLKPLVQNGSFDRWTSFESPISHFSIMIPSNGLEGSGVSSDENGHPISSDVLMAKSDRTFMMLYSGKGANDNLADAAELDKVIKDFGAGANQQAARFGDMISLKFARDLKLNGYLGKQYSLTCNSFSGTVRVFTKQLGTERQVFVLYVLWRLGGDGLEGQFLDSFKITQ
ncbi:MAG TPA: thermonuclease family protein [Pyrinomonadaceae bacterium]|nr:thermonuclease family protein [Pyrinomonadaceae bacterium]